MLNYYNDKCNSILLRCKYISKHNGCECVLVDKFANYENYNVDDKFNIDYSLFKNKNNSDVYNVCDYIDLKYFLIFDRFNNEISELTLFEYLKLLRLQYLEKHYNHINNNIPQKEKRFNCL